jgi:hypothetical protein
MNRPSSDPIDRDTTLIREVARDPGGAVVFRASGGWIHGAVIHARQLGDAAPALDTQLLVERDADGHYRFAQTYPVVDRLYRWATTRTRSYLVEKVEMPGELAGWLLGVLDRNREGVAS